MAKVKGTERGRKGNKYVADNGHAYLDKRTTVRLAQSAGKKAAAKAMDTMGYIVAAKRGWVVRIFPDGREERLMRVDQ